MGATYVLPSRTDAGLRERLAALAERQDGVARRLQLIEAGATPKLVDWMLRALRWRAHGSVVIAMHNGPLDARQQRWVAVLNAGAVAALAARSAAAEYGLSGWEPDCIEVVVPRGTTVLGISEST